MAFLNNGSKSSKSLDEGNVIWDWFFCVSCPGSLLALKSRAEAF